MLQNALGTPLCSYALKHVCNQSNGMAKRNGWDDVVTRDIENTSETSTFASEKQVAHSDAGSMAVRCSWEPWLHT